MARVEVGVTHEFAIEGEKCWVRVALADDYDIDVEDEKRLDRAVDQIAEKVNKKIIDVIEKTIETKNNYEGK